MPVGEKYIHSYFNCALLYTLLFVTVTILAECDVHHSKHEVLYNVNICTGGFLGFFYSMYCIQHCFICRPSDSTVSEDAGIEPRTVATSELTVRRSNH